MAKKQIKKLAKKFIKNPKKTKLIGLSSKITKNKRKFTKTPKHHKKTIEIFDEEKMFNNCFESEAYVKLICCICYKNISNEIKIILEPIKSDEKIYHKGLSFNVICINCFVTKTKFDTKNNNYYIVNECVYHVYKYRNFYVVPKMNRNIITNKWTLKDEIKLLGSIEKLGLNNWEEISKILNKGRYECEAHYYAFYYKSKENFLLNEQDIIVNENDKKILAKNEMVEKEVLSKVIQNSGCIPIYSNSKISHIPKKNIKIIEDKDKLMNKNIFDSFGFWDKRNDFDIEYKNETEILLSELEFKELDTQKSLEMNYKILKNYNNILYEREERKKFICERGLLELKKQINFEKKLGMEERDIYLDLKNNYKYLTKDQFNSFYENHILEKNIKALINQINFYKKNGYKTFEDIVNYINSQKIENILKEEIDKKYLNEEKMQLRNSSVSKNNHPEINVEKNFSKKSKK